MSIRRIVVLAAIAAFAFVSTPVTDAQQTPAVKRTVLLQHDTSAPGFEAVLVAVEIPVGGREGRHFHSGTAMIHVTDGAITLDYEGKPTVRYKAASRSSWMRKQCTKGLIKRTSRRRRIATSSFRRVSR
jgi:hypothetical protein